MPCAVLRIASKFLGGSSSSLVSHTLSKAAIQELSIPILRSIWRSLRMLFVRSWRSDAECSYEARMR